MKFNKNLVKFIKEENRINQRINEINRWIVEARQEGRLGLLSHLRETITALNLQRYELDSKYPQFRGIFLTSEETEEILNIKD